MRIWTTIERYAVGFLPARERSDPDKVVRAKFGFVAGLLLIALGVFRAIELFWLGVSGQAVVLLVAAGLVAAAPVIARITQSSAAAAHFGVAIVVVALVGAAYSSGGAASPALLAFMIVPFLAVFAIGARAGAFWMGVVVSIIAGFAVLERLGLSPPVRYPLGTWNLAKATAAFLFVLIVFALASTYEHARQHAMVEVKRRAESQAPSSAPDPNLGWIASSLDHEANNALAFLAADLHYLESVSDGDREVSAALAEARAGAARLRDIVRDVSTIAEERPSPAAASVDLGEEIGLALVAAREMGFSVSLQEKGHSVYAQIQAADLQRALLNVMTAAGVDAKVAVSLGPGATFAIEAEGGAQPRELAIAAAKRLVEARGGRVDFTRAERSFRVLFELPESVKSEL